MSGSGSRHLSRGHTTPGLRGPTASDGCSNMLAVGLATASGGPILHKTRDNCRTYYGSWFIARPPKGHKYLASSTVGDSNVAMGINEQGVMVGTSSSATAEQHRRGASGRTIAKRILERMDDTRGVSDLLRVTPRAEGFNMLLSDRGGKGMVVEATSYRHWVHVFEDDVWVKTNHFHHLEDAQDMDRGRLAIEQSSHPRHRLASEALRERYGSIDQATMAALSRSHEGVRDGLPWGGSMCSHGAMWSSMSAGTIMPAEAFTDVLSKAWASVGYPCSAPYLPLYIGMEQVPGPLGDGSLATLVDKVFHLVPADEVGRTILGLERGLREEAASVEQEAVALLRSGRRDQAVDRLSAFSYGACDRAVVELERLLDGGPAGGESAGQVLLRAPAEAFIEAGGRGDRMLRFEVLNLGDDDIEVYAELDSVDDGSLGRFPERLAVPAGWSISGLLMLLPSWQPAAPRVPTRLLLREHGSGRPLGVAPVLLYTDPP